MKKIIGILFVFGILITAKVNAQKIRVNLVTTGFSGSITVFDPAVNYDPKNFISIIHLDKNGAGTYTADLAKPRYIVIHFSDYRYSLFLSPGNDLVFKVHFMNNSAVVTVSGKGSNNNQPEIFALTNLDLAGFREDKIPGRVIAALKSQETRNTVILKQYIKRYNPSPAFIRNMQFNNQYFVLNMYYDFYHNTHSPFNTTPDDGQWQRVEDSLLMKHPLNNDKALMSYNYDHLIETFLMRKEERLRIKEVKQHPVSFYRDWYHTSVSKGRVLFAAESKNLFFERIINRFFSGKSAEREYAQMFRFHFRFSDYKNLDLVFEHFKHKYPKSEYIPIFSGAMAEIVAKQKQALNNNMMFVADNGTKLNTMEDVLRLMKGKTVFVDMWGTWCGPCREELEKFTPKIRDHFRGKNIAFLYIANKDMGHEQQWKKTIAYFKIEGLHILANPNLDKDIMTKIKSTGYPTHFIIKKDGTFKKTKMQDELHAQELIKEIEAEL